MRCTAGQVPHAVEANAISTPPPTRRSRPTRASVLQYGDAGRLPVRHHVVGKKGGHDREAEFGELGGRTPMGRWSSIGRDLAERSSPTILDKSQTWPPVRVAVRSDDFDRDVNTPPDKASILDRTRMTENAEPVQAGHHTDDERRRRIEIWTSPTRSRAGHGHRPSSVSFNPLDMISTPAPAVTASSPPVAA